MKKKMIILSFISLMALASASGAIFNFESKSANADEEDSKVLPEGDRTLRLLNVQDYIDTNVLDKFKEYAEKKYGLEKDSISVVYDCTDTPETMFNELKINAGGYDLICPSDYMIQKLIVNDMITKLDMSKIPNYTTYASKYIKEKKLDPITAVNSVTKTTEKVADYAVGYMWGTLGIVFDPTYNGRNLETTVNDMQSWDVMWNPDYKGIGTIKDSVRDTYAIGLLHAYDQDYKSGEETKEGFATMHSKYQDGTYDKETYNAKFSELFNRCDDEAIENVHKDLNKLMGNVFGLEVDQGKQDITTGKIGINFAWSGDAVYSLDQAEDPEVVTKTKELYYSIPQTGSNVWFDAWVMPKYEARSAARVQLAHDFLDFISNPLIAADNMNETGYTSFIAGDEILELVRDWYDIRCDLIYNYVEDDKEEPYNDIVYADPFTGDVTEVWFEDVRRYDDEPDHDYDNVDLYYGHIEFDEEGNITSKLEDFAPLGEKYNDRLVTDPEWEEVDLQYFFEGTLSEAYDDSAYTFYSDCYLPFYNEDGSHNECVGRQFFTQYPDENTLTRCAVMRDFGDQNKAVMSMWEKFKSNTLPVWAIVLFSVEIGLILVGVAIWLINKHRKSSYKKNRKKEA